MYLEVSVNNMHVHAYFFACSVSWTRLRAVNDCMAKSLNLCSLGHAWGYFVKNIAISTYFSSKNEDINLERSPRDSPSQRTVTYSAILSIYNLQQDISTMGKTSSILGRSLLFLLPRFLQPRLRAASDSPNASRKTMMSIEGLRGVACLAVFQGHWTFAINNAYEGMSGDTLYQNPVHWPFIAFLWGSVSAMYVFFAMGGYLLSLNLIRNIHSNKPIPESFSKGILKRCTRILGPPICLIFIYGVMIQLGVFRQAISVREQHHNQFALWEAPPIAMPTIWLQLVDTFRAAFRFMNPLTPSEPSGFDACYDPHLWSLPAEFHNSLLNYLLLCCTWRFKPTARLAFHTIITLSLLLTGQALKGLFIAGLVTAELDLLSEARQKSRDPFRQGLLSATSSPSSSSPPSPFDLEKRPVSQSSSVWTRYLPVLGFTTGLYLLSMPLFYAESTPIYRSLFISLPAFMNGPARLGLMHATGAIMLVWAIGHCSLLTRDDDVRPWYHRFGGLLTNKLTVYIGQISFALYLVHGFVIRSLGYAVLPGLRAFVLRIGANTAAEKEKEGSEAMTRSQIAIIWALGYLVVMPVSVIVADVFDRAVILRCTNLAGWLDEQFTGGKE
jgi:peptidoglycan/LPS O-acetylase OafA/YrhL